MSRARLITTLVAAAIALLLLGLFLFYHFSDDRKLLLPVRKQELFVPTRGRNLPPLHVSGNRLSRERNHRFILRGVTIPDPSYLDDRNLFRRSLFARAKALGANVVRLPVHPDQWATIHDYLWRYLDPAAHWAEANRLYLVISWQATGNIDTGAGSGYGSLDLKQESFAFLDTVSTYFRNAPGVIFELFAQPSAIDAENWFIYAEDLAGTVRRNAPNQLILVDGIDGGTDLSLFSSRQIPGGNIAYAAQVLPLAGNGKQTTEWDGRFGRLSRSQPVVVTSWGYMTDAPESDRYLEADASGFGEPLLTYLGKQNIGWTSAWFDDRWKPPMLSADRSLNAFGQLVVHALALTYP